MAAGGGDKKDFFISYTGADEPWAEWVAWVLEDAGFSTLIQKWDFHFGGNFVANMHKALEGSERTIALLSKAYFASKFCQDEWTAALAKSTPDTPRLLPIRIADIAWPGLFAPIASLDLFDVDDAAAKDRLLAALTQARAKPSAPPRFPGRPAAPPFPGAAAKPPRPAPDAAREAVAGAVPKPISYLSVTQIKKYITDISPHSGQEENARKAHDLAQNVCNDVLVLVIDDLVDCYLRMRHQPFTQYRLAGALAKCGDVVTEETLNRLYSVADHPLAKKGLDDFFGKSSLVG